MPLGIATRGHRRIVRHMMRTRHYTVARCDHARWVVTRGPDTIGTTTYRTQTMARLTAWVLTTFVEGR